MTGLRLNMGAGAPPTHAAAPWVNVDTNEVHEPDVLVTPANPFPFADGEAERIMLGHVLEHVPWRMQYKRQAALTDASRNPYLGIESLGVSEFLLEARRVLAPDGHLLLVGPDVYRAIRRFAAGQEPWEIVAANLEAIDGDDGEGHLIGGAHAWNQHGQRVVEVMKRSGFPGAVEIDITAPDDSWPIISRAPWQCCVAGC